MPVGILEVGFEDEVRDGLNERIDELTLCLQMRQIIKILPKDERQTMLFSATQTTKVEDLARISLRPGPLYINVDNTKEHSTVEGLEQGYVVCQPDKRFLLLFSFLKRQRNKKCIVFFSSCNCVKCIIFLLLSAKVLQLKGCCQQTTPSCSTILIFQCKHHLLPTPLNTSINASLAWICTGNRSRSSEQTRFLNFGEQHSSHVLLPKFWLMLDQQCHQRDIDRNRCSCERA